MRFDRFTPRRLPLTSSGIIFLSGLDTGFFFVAKTRTLGVLPN